MNLSRRSLLQACAVLVLLLSIPTRGDAFFWNPSGPKIIRRAAVLPVSVHNYGEGFSASVRSATGKRLQAELTALLSGAGIEVADQNGVDQALASHDILKPFLGNETTFQPEYEALHAPHGDVMSSDLLTHIAQNRPPTTPLAADVLQDLGQSLGVDALVRVRILKDVRPVQWREPANGGLIGFPFLLHGSPVIFYAQAAAYEKGMPAFDPEVTREMTWIDVIDAATGKLLWSRQWASFPHPKVQAGLKRDVAGFFKHHAPR